MQYDWCPYKMGTLNTHTEGQWYEDTEEEHHVTVEAEIEVIQLQAKECQEFSVLPKL